MLLYLFIMLSHSKYISVYAKTIVLQMGLFHCMVWFGMAHFWGVFHWVQYLVLFSGPPRLRFQASHTVTKMWRVNPADHWLAGRIVTICAIKLATRATRHTRFKSAQPAMDRTQLFIERIQLFWTSASLFFFLFFLQPGSTDVPHW